MFRNVVCALNEALDITMHLKPLTEIFEVIFDIYLPLFSVRNLWGDGSTKKTNNLVFFRRWPQQTFPMFDRCSLRWCTRQVFTANELYRQFCFQICLVYCNSEHYNTTARVIILLQVSFHFEENFTLLNAQEICNHLIDMARKFLDPSSIFQIEVTTRI